MPSFEEDDQLPMDMTQRTEEQSQGLPAVNHVTRPEPGFRCTPASKEQQPMEDLSRFEPGSWGWIRFHRQLEQEPQNLSTGNDINFLNSHIQSLASLKDNLSRGDDSKSDKLLSCDLENESRRRTTPISQREATGHPKSPKNLAKNKQLLRDILDSGKWMGWIDPIAPSQSRPSALAPQSAASRSHGDLANGLQDQTTESLAEAAMSGQQRLEHEGKLYAETGQMNPRAATAQRVEARGQPVSKASNPGPAIRREDEIWGVTSLPLLERKQLYDPQLLHNSTQKETAQDPVEKFMDPRAVYEMEQQLFAQTGSLVPRAHGAKKSAASDRLAPPKANGGPVIRSEEYIEAWHIPTLTGEGPTNSSAHPSTATMRSRQSRRRDDLRRYRSDPRLVSPQAQHNDPSFHPLAVGNQPPTTQIHSVEHSGRLAGPQNASKNQIRIIAPELYGPEPHRHQAALAQPTRVRPLLEHAPVEETHCQPAANTAWEPSMVRSGTERSLPARQDAPSGAETSKGLAKDQRQLRAYTRLGLGFSELEVDPASHSAAADKGPHPVAQKVPYDYPYKEWTPMSVYKSPSLPTRPRTDSFSNDACPVRPPDENDRLRGPFVAMPVPKTQKYSRARKTMRDGTEPIAARTSPNASRKNEQAQGINREYLNPAAFPSCPKAHDQNRGIIGTMVPGPSKSHYQVRYDINPLVLEPPSYPSVIELNARRAISRNDIANGYNIIHQNMVSLKNDLGIGSVMRQFQDIATRRVLLPEQTQHSPVKDSDIFLMLDLAARLRYGQEQASINQIQQGPVYLLQMINIFLNTVFPTDHEKQYSLMRNSYLGYLPKLDLGSIPILRFAVVMLCLSQMGNYYSDARLKHEAEVFYGKALRMLVHYITRRAELASEATMVLTSMLLLTVRTDTFTSISALGDWKVHYRGAEGYLRINGPHWLNICSPSERIIYRNLKEPTLWINLSQRRSPEMTPQQWLDCEESVGPKQVLFAKAIHLSHLLERTEAQCMTLNPTSLRQLARDWLSLRRELLEWSDTNEELKNELKQMQRTTTNVHDAHSWDSDNEVHCYMKANPLFGEFFGFRDGADPTGEPFILNFELRWQRNRYWMFCLIMNCAFLRLAFYHPNDFYRYINFGSNYQLYRAIQRAAVCQADNLCRLFLYLSISEQQGDIDYMHVLCDMTKHYYAEIGSLEKFTWCQGVGDAIAKRRQRLTEGKPRTVCRMRDLHDDLSTLTRWTMPPVPRNY